MTCLTTFLNQDALRGNPDYLALLRTMFMLQAQKGQNRFRQLKCDIVFLPRFASETSVQLYERLSYID